MNDIRVKFGRRLKAVRQQRGMTQEQLAESARISVDFLSLLERGVNAPSFETLDRLSSALQAPPKDFFDFESEERQ